MSCGNRSGKTCHDKSCQRYFNNNAQPVGAGQAIQLTIAGNRVVDSGISIETEPQNFTTLKTGLYHFSGDVVFNATTAGDVILSMYMDGVQLPCTIKTVTTEIGYNAIHTETDLQLSGCCCNVSHSFSFRIQSVAAAVGSVVESCYGAVKLA